MVRKQNRQVADGTRTRDHRDHNPELYQLSYRHLARVRIARPLRHTGRDGPVAQWIERQASNLRAEVQFLPGPSSGVSGAPAVTALSIAARISSGAIPFCR